MNTHVTTRRQWLQRSAAVAAAWSLAPLAPRSALAVDFAQPAPEAAGLTAYQRDGSILLRYDNRPLLGYRAQPSLKYPYFNPLNGPVSGLSLTAESALPYPHHRGLWLGCDPLGGGNYWADNGLDSGQIRTMELTLDEVAPDAASVSFTQKCSWERPGSNPFSDQRQYSVRRPDERHLLIDCAFELTAHEDIKITSAKHSFFAMRAAADISPTYGGTLFNSEGGTGAAGTYGKPASWCGYFGKRRLRPDVVEGIAIMDHPENFGGQCPWFTRDYGHLSPSPFAFLDGTPWTLQAGQTLGLQYRVVLFAGTPDEAGLDDLYQAWLA